MAAHDRLHRRAAARAHRQAAEAQAPRPVLGRPRAARSDATRSADQTSTSRTHDLTPLTAHHVLEYPGGYTRSVGPVIGRFLTGLRDGRIEGVRLADGRVLVPPTEYDPTTSDAIAPTATTGRRSARRDACRRSRGCREPRPGKHPLAEAVRVRADPARRCRHRDAARGRLRHAPTRSRVGPARRAALARRAHRAHHRHRGVGAARRRRGAEGRAAARRRTRTSSRSPASCRPIQLEYELNAGRRGRALPRGLGEGKIVGGTRAVERRRLRGVARHRPEDRRADVDRGRGAGHRCRSRRSASSTCPGLSELAPEIPYVSAQILLDGANNTFFGLIRGVDGRRRAHGPAREGEVGRRAEARPHVDRVVRAHRRARRRLRALQGLPVMRDVAVVSFAYVRGREGRRAQRGRDARAAVRDGDRAVGHRAKATSASRARAASTTSRAGRSRS